MKKKLFNRVLSAVTGLITGLCLLNATLAGAVTFTPTYYDDDNKVQILELYSQSAFMMNLETGEVVLNINGSTRRATASLTKIMTAIVMLDTLGDDETTLENTVVYGDYEAFDELVGAGASTADIQPWEHVSYYDLLAAMLIPSGSEAANIIAVNVGGSLDGFVEMMNRKVEELGLENTHFSCTHGVYTQQNYSSCEDIAKMCKYALDNHPLFREIVSTRVFYMDPTDFHNPGSVLTNTNLMLDPSSPYYYSLCKGIKTGSSEAAGSCLASYAEYDQTPYITVTMGAPMEKRDEDYARGEADPDSIFAEDYIAYNCLDHIHLYNWAFNMLEPTDFINSSSEVREVKVAYGKKVDYANLRPVTGYSQMWPINVKTEEVQRVITVKENIVAPIEEGDVLGSMELRYNGETLTTIDLVSTVSIERSPMKERVAIAKSYFRSGLFKGTMTVIIIGLGLYCIVHFILAQKKYLRKHNR